VPTVITLRKPGIMESGDTYVGRFGPVALSRILPIFKPPWGSLVAIDMTTGEHRWREPVGSGQFRELNGLGITDRLGWPMRSFALVTKSLVFTVQAGYHNNGRPAVTNPFRRMFDLNNLEPRLAAYDKATGALVAEIVLPANASGAPMTYMAGGKQHIVFPVGGANLPEELIALTLP
jgi:quinoprotein glucose dehydrogenase